MITRRPSHSSYPDLVGDLIDWSAGAWNMDLTKQYYLWSCDVFRVLQVPLGAQESEDMSYWFFSNNGNFTVRSCYYRIFEQKREVEASSLGASNLLELKEWKWIWGLQLSPKIRTFLWRAGNHVIPVRVAMVSAGWDMILFVLFALPMVRQSFAAWFRLLHCLLAESSGAWRVVCGRGHHRMG